MKLFVIAALAAFGISTAYASEPATAATPAKAEKKED
jgi:hypothetical protein